MSEAFWLCQRGFGYVCLEGIKRRRPPPLPAAAARRWRRDRWRGDSRDQFGGPAGEHGAIRGSARLREIGGRIINVVTQRRRTLIGMAAWGRVCGRGGFRRIGLRAETGTDLTGRTAGTVRQIMVHGFAS